MLSFIAALSFLAFARAQSDNGAASSADLAAVQANFNNAGLVPDLLEMFNPEGTLGVSYNNQAITTGQNLSQSDVGTYPSLTLYPGSNTTDISTSDKYTVMLIDANIPGTDESTEPQTRHWLVNSAGLTSSGASYAIDYNGATSITDYAGPGPAAGSGPHRYVVLMYYQPSSFSPPANLSSAGTPLGTMFLSSYVSDSGLGDLVAANYFQVENGVATVTYPTTTAVNTASLGGVTTTSGAVSGSTMASMTMSGSASGSGSAGGAATSSAAASASASKTGAGATQREMGWGVVMGAMGVAGAVIGAGVGL